MPRREIKIHTFFSSAPYVCLAGGVVALHFPDGYQKAVINMPVASWRALAEAKADVNGNPFPAPQINIEELDAEQTRRADNPPAFKVGKTPAPERWALLYRLYKKHKATPTLLIKQIAAEEGLSYSTVTTAFRQLRDDVAPFSVAHLEGGYTDRPLALKPGGKIL